MELPKSKKSNQTDSSSDDHAFESVVQLLLKEQATKDLSVRNEKLKRLLLLLSKGVMLATVLAAPKSSMLFRGIMRDKSDWKEWKQFNTAYLRKTIRKLENQKIVNIENVDGVGVVKITSQGKKEIYRYMIESLSIPKPSHWDGKWRLVFYDVERRASAIRDKFRTLLVKNGFYPLQESVYLHAYPCEKEITFLRTYLGIGSNVRIVIAEQIENDQEFRDYFGL